MTDSLKTSTVPRVVVGIVTYNRKAMLRQCLQALQEQTYPLAGIVVVDNASSDGTAEMVGKEFPEHTLRTRSENRGVADGFCTAIQEAEELEADWVWMMDDDAEPHPKALERLFSVGLHSRSDTVALTSLKQFPSGTPQYDHSGWYDPVEGETTPVGASSEAWTEVGVGGYAGLLCRLDAIKRVGPPDPGFFFWYGDIEFCLRLAKVGRLYLVRSSLITHHVSEKSRSRSGNGKPWRHHPLQYYWRYYYSYRNRLFILFRHGASRSEKMHGVIVLLLKALRSAGMVCVYHRDDTMQKLGLLTQGVIDGLLGRSGKRVDPERYVNPSSR